ncbi:unnamed protein product [Plutella xylostella]|uniref:(diamondback moth) hypothetical protein n=1 Tax=Plutella xylostella TaxID=51655 RepID=A0A8S4E1M3_PLUXY|nr:unnamed protein product [Plutella xylostella]
MAEVLTMEIEVEELKASAGGAAAVKQEPGECAACGAAAGAGALDAAAARTPSGASLLAVLLRYCPAPAPPAPAPALACPPCAELILVLDGAEQEYLRLRRRFEQLLAANPLLAPRAPAPAPAPAPHAPGSRTSPSTRHPGISPPQTYTMGTQRMNLSQSLRKKEEGPAKRKVIV